MRRLTTTIIASTTALSLLGLVGCSNNASPAATTPESLAGTSIVVYNAQHKELTQALADEFTKTTGVAVTFRQGSDSELGNQLVQEGAGSPADVFITENSPSMSLVERAGLFADVDAETLAQVPVGYRPSTGKWTGIAARSTVFVYNPSKLPETDVPNSLVDLADPKWKGRWAASPSGADFQAIVSALLEIKGEEETLSWLKAMKENFAPYKGNTTVMKAVNAGEVPAGVIYHYYWFRDQAGTKENSSNTKLHYFKNQDPGAFVSTSGGGVLRSGKNQAAGQAFLKFITGKTGQQILQTGTSYEYPVASDVEPNPALPTLASLAAPTIDPSTLNSSRVTDLMTRVGLI